MSNVFFSFLGLGTINRKTGNFEYTEARYEYLGYISRETRFVQCAELEILNIPGGFERIFIATTEKAKMTHFAALSKEIALMGFPEPELIILEEDMSTRGQWRWFEQILEKIGKNDSLTVDLTHGYRSIPIVFSAAINFLQRAKNIVLDHVLYGAFDKNRSIVPVIDMKDFYAVNVWADGVERIVEGADTRKLSQISQSVPEYQVSKLSDRCLVSSLEELTNRIRNVDVNNISYAAEKALNSIVEIVKDANIIERLLLGIVLEKYKNLTPQKSLTGNYNATYFEVQLSIIELFNEHKLYMQSFTAMREFIGSLGLIEIKKAKYDNDKGRNLRRKYSGIFINMLQRSEEEWGYFTPTHHFYKPEDEKHANELLPFYNKLKKLGIEKILRSFVGEMTMFRNRLDHAWTEQAGFDNHIIENAPLYLEKLQTVIKKLKEHKILE